MQFKVLNDLYKQGGITFFAYPEAKEIPLAPLQNIALALNAGARFMVVDFSGKNRLSGNGSITASSLIEGLLEKNTIEALSQTDEGLILTGLRCFPQDDQQFRNLYHNIELLKKNFGQVVAVLPCDLSKDEARYAALLARVIVIDGDSGACAAFLEDLPPLQSKTILWVPEEIPGKTFPHAQKAVVRSESRRKSIRNIDYKKQPQEYAKVLEGLHKIAILKKNPLDGSSKFFRKVSPLLFLLAIAIPFFFVTKIEPGVSNMRDRTHERNNLSVAPSFEYTFDGKETMQRIARYAIGRFNATITNEKMIRQYVDLTLDENGYTSNSWEKNNFNIPPEGTIIKFSRPDFLENTASDSIGAAWKYWTSIVSDSITYITEFYHAKATPFQRQHNGIDVASRQGARILAPFAAKAWTSRDERGGIIIGLVREKDVLIFMHCDQLLYLDGQEVMAGDPIATVGLTGHTTGPHAHVVTGIISKKGSKRIGNVRYNVIDPIEWFYRFKPNR